MELRLIDRLLLLAAYGLLVGVSAWNAWNTVHALQRIEEEICATAEVAVAAPLLNLVVYGDQEGVDDDAVVFTIETLVAVGDAIKDRCGTTFLDELNLPGLNDE